MNKIEEKITGTLVLAYSVMQKPDHFSVCEEIVHVTLIDLEASYKLVF